MERGQVSQKETVRQRFAEADLMRAKETLERDVDDEEKKKERQRPEPAAHIKERDVPGLAEIAAVPDQDLPDQEAAQDEKQFHAVEPAVTEDREGVAEMRVEHDEAMGADHHENGRGPEQIEAEDAAGFARRLHAFFRWPTISLSHVRRSTRVRCFSRPRLSKGRCGMSQRYSATNQISLSEVIQWRSSKRARFTGRE